MKIHIEIKNDKETIILDASGKLLFFIPFINLSNNPRPKLLKFIKKKTDGTMIERYYQEEKKND